MTESIEGLTKQAEAEWFELFTTGPTNTTRDKLPPQIGDQAPDHTLQTQDGDHVQLSEFWKDGPALLLFWRHFGCGCGAERATRLGDEHDDYIAAGASVVIVGEGEPPRARRYATDHGIPCPILCDPNRETYTAYGLRDFTVPEVLHGASDPLIELDADAAEELAADRRQQGNPLVDNPWQQPGEFVIDADGILQLTYRYQYCEDYPDPAVLLTAIEQASN